MRRSTDLFCATIRRTSSSSTRLFTKGPSFEYRVSSEDGDTTPRRTCMRCGFVDYENPKVVCGSVLTVGGNIVLGRRAIEPRRGFWGIPAGYLEMGETGEEGAAREAREELNADVRVGRLLAVYSLPHIGQMQLIYSSVLKNEDRVDQGGVEGSSLSAGQETDEVALFRWEDIPWDRLAFPTTSWALWHHYRKRELASQGDCLGSPTPETTQTTQTPSATGTSSNVGPEQGFIKGGNDLACSTERLDSGGPVFSAPTGNRSLFWCPARGLHLKQGWKPFVDG
ncbi:unnamed protein product [Ascophyllum nodosum]